MAFGAQGQGASNEGEASIDQGHRRRPTRPHSRCATKHGELHRERPAPLAPCNRDNMPPNAERRLLPIIAAWLPPYGPGHSREEGRETRALAARGYFKPLAGWAEILESEASFVGLCCLLDGFLHLWRHDMSAPRAPPRFAEPPYANAIKHDYRPQLTPKHMPPAAPPCGSTITSADATPIRAMNAASVKMIVFIVLPLG